MDLQDGSIAEHTVEQFYFFLKAQNYNNYTKLPYFRINYFEKTG